MSATIATAAALSAGMLMAGAALAQPSAADWPVYNRTLKAERFTPLAQINRGNVKTLKRLCVYDFGYRTGNETGPIVIGRTLYATTVRSTVAIDADTCAEKWRVDEAKPQGGIQTNRGLAYADGRLFRGMQDGRVIALDAATGARLWETKITKAPKETLPAAPIAWGGLVFIGNAGGDNIGVKGRMYGLDAATGKVVWESYMVPRGVGDAGMANAPDMSSTWGNEKGETVGGGGTWTSYTLDPATGTLYVPGGNPSPDLLKSFRKGENLFTNAVVAMDAKTGAYRTHYATTPDDEHDWDTASAPILVTTRRGRQLIAEAGKDGQLHVFDRQSGKRIYKVDITTRLNTDAPLGTEPVHFCPGLLGGSEWNSPAYSPATNTIYTGAVDWCSTLTLIKGDAEDLVANRDPTKPFTGGNPPFGVYDQRSSGWITATNADTGAKRWAFHAPNPVVSGVTPTAGGLVFFGDTGGDAFALDDRTGEVLWREVMDGAVMGGVITYAIDGQQRVAFTTGLVTSMWPIAKKDSAKIVIYGLG